MLYFVVHFPSLQLVELVEYIVLVIISVYYLNLKSYEGTCNMPWALDSTDANEVILCIWVH